MIDEFKKSLEIFLSPFLSQRRDLDKFDLDRPIG